MTKQSYLHNFCLYKATNFNDYILVTKYYSYLTLISLSETYIVLCQNTHSRNILKIITFLKSITHSFQKSEACHNV